MFNVYDVKYNKKKNMFIVLYSDGSFFNSAHYYKADDFVRFIDKCMNIQFAINLLKDTINGVSTND